MPWIKTYAPKTTKDILGQTSCKQAVEAWTEKSKPILLWGPYGSGKTVTAHALANELGLELLEVNASDSRKAGDIQTIIGGALKQGSLFGTKKLILIDEVEGLSGTKDRGAIPSLIKIIKGSTYPIMITAIDPFTSKLSSLRKVCELVEYKSLEYKDIAHNLKIILDKENIVYEENDVNKIARGAGGDMRAAINDAQVFSISGKLILGESEREQTDTIQNALLRVFKTTQAQTARGAFDRVNEDIDKIMLWIDENIDREYKKIPDIRNAHDALSHADKFLGRIRRWQHYRFYVYAYDLTTAGIAIAKEGKYKELVKYRQTTRLLKIWMANQKNAKKKAIAEKIAAKTHTSKRRALQEIGFIQSIFANNKTKSQQLANYFDLSKEEREWLKN